MVEQQLSRLRLRAQFLASAQRLAIALRAAFNCDFLRSDRRVNAAILMCLVAGTVAAGEFDERAATIAFETEKAAHRLVILGSWDEAERVLRSALEITEVLESDTATAVLQARLGYALTHRTSHSGGSFDEAIEVLQRALDGAREAGDAVTVGNALAWLAQALYHRKLWYELGDYERVYELYEQAYEVRAEADDSERIGESLFHLGIASERTRSRAEAADYYRRALDRARERSDWLLASYALRHLTYVDAERMTEDEVIASHEQVLAWREQVRFRVGILYGNVTLASVHLQYDNPERAEPHVEAACETAKAINSRRGLVSCQLVRTRLARRLGADATAGEACASAQEIAKALAMPRLMDAASDCRKRDET